jgi:hypothetical protein
MTAKWAVLTGAVTIDSTNRDIRITANAVTATVTLVNGTYYLIGDGSADDLLGWLDSAITSHPEITSVTISSSVSIDSGAAVSSLTITPNISCNILFGNALTTFDEGTIGFDGDTGLDASHSNTDSPSLIWVSNEPPFLDDRGPWESQSEQTITVDGKTRTFTRGTAHERRMLSFDFVAPKRTIKSAWGSSSSNQTFESWWDNHRDGRKLRYYNPALSSGTTLAALSSSNFISTYTLDESSVASWSPRRLQPGLELYGWSVGLRKYAT